MALKNSQYYALMREYEQTRLKNHDLQMKRYEEVYKKLPEFKSLDESISILSVQYGKKMLNGDPKALSSLKEELAILRQNKKNLLTSAGFPKDYLEPIYDCPDVLCWIYPVSASLSVNRAAMREELVRLPPPLSRTSIINPLQICK